MKKLPLLAVAGVLAAAAPFAAVHAAPIVYTANLAGAFENPPIDSPGTGFSTVTYDPEEQTLRVVITFSGLDGVTTVAHIHCCVDPPTNVGVASTTPTFPGFPAGVTGGDYDETFDLTLASSFNPAFVAANGGTPATAEAALALGIASGQAYVNIHTDLYPPGEIRGFLAPIPLPAAFPLMLTGVAGMFLYRLRRRRDPRAG